MKPFILGFLLVGHGQSNKPTLIKIDPDRLKTITDVHQLIPDLSTDCKIIRFELLFKKKDGPVRMFEDLRTDTQESVKAIEAITSLPPGSFIQVSVKRTDCNAIVGKHYKVSVTDEK